MAIAIAIAVEQAFPAAKYSDTVDQTCSQKCAELVRRFAHSWGLKQLYYESDRGYGWSRIGLY